MKPTEHLLTCLAEEAGEVAKDVHKSLRFGLNDRNVLKPDGPTNRERLIEELNDFMAVVDMLVQREILPANWQNSDKQEAKQHKVAKFMDYAVQVGALERYAFDQRLTDLSD